ncbi:MAG: hypothetical protein KDC98_08945, partial [Planctomycetes bacterium]|nr:hypothetical protein [Planctomycetota bacterium]
MIRHALSLSLLVASLGASLSAQEWSSDFTKAGLTGRCFSLGTYGGDLIAGGQAFQHDGRRIDGIARFDGNTWHPIGTVSALGAGGLVRAIVEWNGELYAAGEFPIIGGTLANAVARWDGSQWHPLGTGLTDQWGWSSAVHALAVYQGELYAGGMFASAGGQPIPGLARWNGSSWRPVGGGLTAHPSYGPRVTALHAATDGKLYIGGSFYGSGGVSSANLIAWDGTAFSAVGGGIPLTVSTFVFAIDEYQGDLVVGGNFGAIGSLIVDNVARFDGQQWHALDGGVRDWAIGVAVHSLQVWQGSLYVGGDFVDVGPSGNTTPALRVARWDGQWHGIGGISGSDLTTTAIAMTQWNDELVVGGEFSVAGTTIGIGQSVVST